MSRGRGRSLLRDFQELALLDNPEYQAALKANLVAINAQDSYLWHSRFDYHPAFLR